MNLVTSFVNNLTQEYVMFQRDVLSKLHVKKYRFIRWNKTCILVYLL